MSRNFDGYPGFQPFRSWANTYAQDCICATNTPRFKKLSTALMSPLRTKHESVDVINLERKG